MKKITILVIGLLLLSTTAHAEELTRYNVIDAQGNIVNNYGTNNPIVIEGYASFYNTYRITHDPRGSYEVNVCENGCTFQAVTPSPILPEIIYPEPNLNPVVSETNTVISTIVETKNTVETKTVSVITETITPVSSSNTDIYSEIFRLLNLILALLEKLRG